MRRPSQTAPVREGARAFRVLDARLSIDFPNDLPDKTQLKALKRLDQHLHQYLEYLAHDSAVGSPETVHPPADESGEVAD